MWAWQSHLVWLQIHNWFYRHEDTRRYNRIRGWDTPISIIQSHLSNGETELRANCVHHLRFISSFESTYSKTMGTSWIAQGHACGKNTIWRSSGETARKKYHRVTEFDRRNADSETWAILRNGYRSTQCEMPGFCVGSPLNTVWYFLITNGVRHCISALWLPFEWTSLLFLSRLAPENDSSFRGFSFQLCRYSAVQESDSTPMCFLRISLDMIYWVHRPQCIRV